jgi:uncharacterized protein (TIGR03086 family)
MDPVTLHRRTVEAWTSRVAAVEDDQWDLPTPCPDWDVRALVNHVVSEDAWTVELLAGRTLSDVGDSLDGDLLGDDGAASAAQAASEAVSAAGLADPDGTVALSYGVEQVGEYLRQLSADHLIHAWDLAKATSGDLELASDLVTEVATWYADREELYRSAGLVGPRAEAAGDQAQDRLVAAFGRRP